MKKYTVILSFTFGVIIFGVMHSTINACPRCNTTFYDELNTTRENTLVSKELLGAMNNYGTAGSQYSGEISSVVTKPTGNTIQAPFKDSDNGEFIEIINRDNGLSIPPTSYVPQNTVPTKKVSIDLYEGEVYIGNGVIYKGFVTNGTIPGPTIIVEEGDIVEFTVNNKGNIPHGASIHAAYTQTSKYLGKIPAGESRKMVFKVATPGVYMYHCAPGGHAIPMHIIFGQYGMMVVKPKKPYKLEQILNKKPDVEIYLNQHEFYASGKDAVTGDPMYVTFNGKIFRYVEEPIKAKPGDYVRIYFLNSGPNLLSTFHIVGIIWDYVYWQGNPDVSMPGGQSVTTGPADSWVIEFRMPPDEGAYTMLTHAVGSTDRGAIGLIVCDDSADTPTTVIGDGPSYTQEEMDEIKSKATRTISPFEPGSPDVDVPVVYDENVKEVTIQIIGNSYYPKVVKVTPGTKVRWVNEDVFSYMEGEFAGIHNVASYESPEPVMSELLAHTESFEFVFEEEGDYKYMCTPHPYMRGVVTVYEAGSSSASGGMWVIILSVVSIAILVVVLIMISSIKKKYGAAVPA
jgi:nitrite reductase (NO-forming)